MHKKKNSGLNLMELMAVIIIMGVLATIAITQFSTSKERAIGKEAQASLKLILAAEKIYKMETGSYYGPASASQINDALKLYLASTNWAYSITAAGANSFSAQADRNGSGGYLECVYSIDENDSEPSYNASCRQ